MGGLGTCFNEVLEPWLTSEEPVNAWDAFGVNQVSQHYAFTGMMSIRAANLRMPAFDNEVFDIYLQMSPQQRINGSAVLHVLEKISPELSKIPNANTGFSACLGPWKEIAALLTRASLRRAGIVGKVHLPSNQHSAGSWQNLGNLFRNEPSYRKNLMISGIGLIHYLLGCFIDQLSACINTSRERKITQS